MKKQLPAFFNHKYLAGLSANLRLTNIVVVVVVIASLIFTLSPAQSVLAAGPFTVNTTNDTHCTRFVSQGAPGCTASTDSGGLVSLRSALEDASTLGGTTIITLPAGTYNLSLGDLVAGTQANTTINIQGAGAANTIINQTTAGRMVFVVNYNLNANIAFNLSGVTVSGGRENENDPDGFGGNGGAILAGGSASATGNSVSVTNAVFSGNFCSPITNAGCSGGAISMSGGGSLTVDKSTFTGNIASKNRGFGSGGAIYFDNGGNGGNVSITNSTFTNNIAQGNSTTGGQGGAVRLAGGTGTTYAVSNNTFTGNAANGTAAAGANGGAITLISGSLTANFNRIVGNTSANASGLFVGNNAGTVGSATNNWWGCNGGPSAGPCDTAVLGTPNQGGSLTFNPWIVLTNTASPNPIQVNQTTTLTADFLHNSSAGALTTGQISVLIGLPVTWGSAVNGALSGSQTTIQANGTASSTFTANAAGGGNAGATVDSGTGTASITINKANTTTSLLTETPDPTVTGQAVAVTFSITSSTGTSPTAPTSDVTVSDGTNSCTGSLASGTCNITLTSAGNKSLTATYNGDANFNKSTSSPATPHTVNKADTTTVISSNSPNPAVVGQPVTFNFNVSVTPPGAGAPSGNITISDGGSNTCTASVASGSCTINFTSAGSFSLTVTYTGDSNFNGSASSLATSQTVNKADTTTTITSDNPDPSGVGQAVAVNFAVAPVAPGAGTPTGNVTVSDGKDSCTGTVVAGTCSISLTTGGARTLTAAYAGDSNFIGSTSSGEPHTVTTANLAITKAHVGTFNQGSTGTWTLQVTNNAASASTATDGSTVNVADSLPSGYTLSSSTGIGWSCSGTSIVTCTSTAVVAGAGGNFPLISLIVNIPSNSPVSVSNTASVFGGGDATHTSLATAATSTDLVNVNTAPTVTTNPSDQLVLAGQTATFSAAASGSPVPSVQWQISTDGGATFNNIPGATSTTLSFIAASTDDANQYRAVFTNIVGSATSTAGILTISKPPTVTTDPSDQTVNVGQTASFTAAASGIPSPTVQWWVSTDGGTTFNNISGATSTTLSFSTTASQDGNLFKAVFTNMAGSASTTAATLTVNVAPTVTTNPTDVTVNAGQTASFSAAASGKPTPTVQWQVSTDGGSTFNNISGATSATLSFSTTSSQDGNQFRAVFTNSAGTATSSAATLTVNTAPVVTTQPTDQNVLAGGTATFSAAASGKPVPTVQWQVSIDGGATFTNIAGATSTTLSFTTAQTDNGNQYRAVFTNIVGSATSNAATLKVGVPPTVTTNPTDLTVNAGQTASFSASAAGNPVPTVQWQLSTNGGSSFSNISGATSATLSFTAAASQNGYKYRAVFTNPAGSATTTAATLTVKVPTSLLYNGGQIVVLGSTFQPAAVLSSSNAICTVNNQTISFSLDRNPTNGTSGSYSLGTATTNSSGQSAMSAVSTSGWQEGIYTITASFNGSTNCIGSSNDATLTAAGLGDSANGGGWYTLSGSGRINFGFTVRKSDNTCTSNCTYNGQLLLINNGKWRLKGTLNGYVKTSTGTGAASGNGDLFWWNQNLNGGLGDWVLAKSGVSFTINFFDSGNTGKSSTDTFGINIQYTPVSPQPGTLPNSKPQLLKGGNITVR